MATPRLEGRDAETQWGRLIELIAERMGLHFPRERRAELERGLAGAAEELGFEDVAACTDRLLSGPLTRAHLKVLASHLTIGETYFFREKKTFESLATHVLPALIHARRGRLQRLRLWSAACCSGEEAYSLAILMGQLLPDLAAWHVTILATDINPHALRKAVTGVYGEWSFRDAPAGFKERYFTRTAERRYAIRPEIQKLVTFEHLNLVEDVYPALATDTNAMDIILCRNVLMYFTPGQIPKVIGNLHRALIDGGWLAVSPSETSQTLFPQFVTHNFPGVILYQRKTTGGPAHDVRPPMVPRTADLFVPLAPAVSPPWIPPVPAVQTPSAPPPENPASVDARATPRAMAASLYEKGRYAEAVDVLLAVVAEHAPESAVFSLLARALANQGRLADARSWCDRWIAADKLNAAGHYLRAVVLLEEGLQDEARRSLKKAVYLDPNFVLAHFALGTFARSRGRHDEATRHFANTLHLLSRLGPDDLLPESDGLTVARLTETTTALAVRGRTP